MPEDPSVPPLVRKLGLKPGMRACVLDAPPHYARLLAPLPAGVTLQKAPAENLAFIQVFVGDRGALQRAFARLTPHLASDGMLWMCWPKQSSTLAADFTGTDVRRAGLAAGLVDVKVCAIDADWSGLKFVYRRADR